MTSCFGKAHLFLKERPERSCANQPPRKMRSMSTSSMLSKSLATKTSPLRTLRDSPQGRPRRYWRREADTGERRAAVLTGGQHCKPSHGKRVDGIFVQNSKLIYQTDTQYWYTPHGSGLSRWSRSRAHSASWKLRGPGELRVRKGFLSPHRWVRRTSATWPKPPPIK